MSFVTVQHELFLVGVQYGLLLAVLFITGQCELFLIVLFVAV